MQQTHPWRPAAASLAALAAAVAVDHATAQTFVAFESTERHFYAFDLQAAGSERLVAIGESSYVRGLEMTDERNGWFISTQSVEGSSFGLFRIRDGAVAHIADLPFQSTAIGGMSFNRHRDGFYVALNPPGAPQSLYRMDFAGNIDLIGAMFVRDAASATIAGLATDPRTGELYGLDTANKALLRIDRTTGVGEIVGDGLGIHILGAGGLDFAEVGGAWRLYGATAAGGIREIDLSTGRAGALLGEPPFGASGAFAAVPAPASGLALAAGPVVAARRRR